MNSEKLKPVGEGQQKEVFEDPSSSERVIGLYKYQESLTRVKARYYLTKILHELLPENIPDIHLSSSKPNATKREKVHLDELHLNLQKLYLKQDSGQWTDADETTLTQLEREAKIRQYYDHHDLVEILHNLGIAIDEAADNFGYDKNDKLKYFEDFPAVKIEDGKIIKLFDEQKLENAIREIRDNKQREITLSYLERLKDICSVRK